MDTDPKLTALAKYLDIDPEEIEQASYDSDVYEIGREEYRVLDDSEADSAAENSITETLWAFSPEFLASHSDADAEIFKILQDTGRCESLTPAIQRMITDWDHFVQDAINADGRGHFLNSYDGEEIELEGSLYAYRIN